MNRSFFSAAVALALLTCSRPACAQSFDINWFTIAGGGGTSTGGVYAITGTIGQGHTGESSGDTYSIEDGFWSLLPPAPSPGMVVAWGNNGNGQTNPPAGLDGVMAIAAGFYHSVALKNDATVVAWGLNTDGQTSVPSTLKNVKAIAAGGNFTLALGDDGTVAAWGLNSFGQTSVPTTLGTTPPKTKGPVVAIAAGYEHAVALLIDGTVVGWGRNSSGATTVPAGLSNVTAVAAGNGFTLALKKDGTVVAWGYNGYGQTDVPMSLSGVTAIAAGYFHSVALKSDGTVAAWGYNGGGQTDVPATLNGVTKIASAGDFIVALKSDGTVVAWGANGSGQTVVPEGLSGVTAVTAGLAHAMALVGSGASLPVITTQPLSQTVVEGQSASFAVTASGSAPLDYQWQKDGVDITGETSASYTLASAQTGQAGAYTVVVSNTAGSVTNTPAAFLKILPGAVVAWGLNDSGQTNVPAGLRGVTAIAAGFYHTVALRSDGTVLAWGLNTDGQTLVPTGLADVTAIAAGATFTLALKKDMTVVGWGSNVFGQTTVPAGVQGNATAIAAGYYHSVALLNDGTVAAWGSNHEGETAVPSGLGGVKAIAAGYYHTVALKSDGTVVAWGFNAQGQTTVPAGLTDVMAIAAGYGHTVALKKDGTVVAWGPNNEVTRVPTGLHNVIAIAAGQYHTLALENDGTIVAWGDDFSGSTSLAASFTGVTAIAAGGYHSVAIVDAIVEPQGGTPGPGSNTPIPGGTGNFTGVGAPSLSGSGLAFYGSGSDGQQGIYTAYPGGPIRIADRNTAIPSGTGLFSGFALNGLAGVPALSGNNVAFYATGPEGQQGIYSFTDGALVRVADTATAIPNGSGLFTGFYPGGPIVPPDPCISGNNVVFSGTGSGGQQGIYAVIDGSLGRVADTATSLPGGTGAFVAFPSSPVISGANVAFLGTGMDNQQGVYLSLAGLLGRVADTTTAIPGGSGLFTSFFPGAPITPAINGQSVAFLGMGAGGQAGVYEKTSSSLAKVADLHSAIPGGIGSFTGFGQVSVSSTDVAFLGTGSSAQQGIYDLTGGTLIKVVDLNTIIDGKTITGLMFANNGLDGDPISYAATFSDGSQGIYTVSVPRGPALVPARFVGPISLGADGLVFNLALVPGQHYRIQVSTDLVVWSDWANLLASASRQEFIDAVAASMSRRFYRVLSP